MTEKIDKKVKNKESDKMAEECSSEKEWHHEPVIQSAIAGGKTDLNHILKVNERGVIVIPREVLEKMDIRCGGELLLVTMAQAGMAPMIMLIPLKLV